MKHFALGLTLVAAIAAAQSYRCDWSVVGIGGGEMSSSVYRCGSTAGQTAVGQLTGTNYQAFIGFWQIDVPVGIQERVERPDARALVTRLYSPAPNPARSHVTFRYSLAAGGMVRLVVHDIAGRAVRTLCASSMERGVYNVTWNGRDARGRELADGTYFCRFTTADGTQTERLVLIR
jgi:hypothetical protein